MVDKDPKNLQRVEANSAFLSADFRAALTTEFDKAALNPATKGLLAPQIAALVEGVVQLEAKLRTDYGADFDETIVAAEVAAYLNKLVSRVIRALDQLLILQEQNPDQGVLNQASEIFTEHHRVLAEMVFSLERKPPNLVIDGIDGVFQALVARIRQLGGLADQFKPKSTESLAEKTAREDRERRFDNKRSIANQILTEIDTKLAAASLNFRAAFNATYVDSSSGTPTSTTKNFASVYQALAESTFKLENDPDFTTLAKVAEAEGVSHLANANTIAWERAKTNLKVILTKAYGVDKKSGLARRLLEADDFVKSLVAAKAPFIAPGVDFDGTTDYAVQLSALKTAKTNFDSITLPSIADDPEQILQGLKMEFDGGVQDLIARVEINQWLVTIETTYPKLTTLKNTYAPILAGTLVYPTEAEGLRDVRNDLEGKINESKNEVDSGPKLDSDKSAKLETLYFDKAQRALEIVIREQDKRAEADSDYMNMPPAKLAKIIGEFGGFGLEIEHTAPTGADPSEIRLREAYQKRFFLLRLEKLGTNPATGLPFPEDPVTRLKPLSPEDMEMLEAKMDVVFTRLDNKMNASNAIPEGNRGDMNAELFSSLSLEKDEVIHGLTAHPLYGELFSELTQRLIWTVGLKKGWQVNAAGKIEPAGTSPDPRAVYNERYDYGSGICASGGKIRLQALIGETFDKLLPLAPVTNQAAIQGRSDYIKAMAYHWYMGLNLLDASLALRQRIGEQTKGHDSKTSTNFAIVNNPFDDLTHSINRYEKGFELSKALYLMFYPKLRKEDLLDRGKTGDPRSETKFKKLKLWRKLLIEYFNITGSSLKGVIPELDASLQFPRPGNADDVRYMRKDGAGHVIPVEVRPIGIPEWGDEVFPSYQTIFTKIEFRDHQAWDQYYRAEKSWMKFMDTIAEPVPAGVTIEQIMGTKNDGLLTTLVESPILGQAKLVKGNHFNYVAPMLTFYVQELMANFSPRTRVEKARALKRIVQKLDDVSKSGLDAMYPQIQKVIANIKGDGGFKMEVEGHVEAFDSEFIFKDQFDLVKPIIEYEHACEEFVHQNFDVHGSNPNIGVNWLTGRPMVKLTKSFVREDEKARLDREASHILSGHITRPYGVTLTPSKEKTTEE